MTTHDLQECAICQETLLEIERCQLYPCNHRSFHKECIIAWFKQSDLSECPLCRVSTKAYSYNRRGVSDSTLSSEVCVCGAYHQEKPAEVYKAFVESGLYHPPATMDRHVAIALREIINNAASALSPAKAQVMFQRLREAIGPSFNRIGNYMFILELYVEIDAASERVIKKAVEMASGKILIFVLGYTVPATVHEDEWILW